MLMRSTCFQDLLWWRGKWDNRRLTHSTDQEEF